MDQASFHAEINKIVDEYRLDQHPYVKLVNEGRATRDQLRGYPKQHYEMTVRDSAPLSAVAYLKMYDLDPKVAHGSAKGFAEEALGLYSHSAGHTELLFELWEGGLGLPRDQLINSVGSEEARLFNASMYRLMHLKPQFLGATGLCEEVEVEAYKRLQEGLERHYGFNPTIPASCRSIMRPTRITPRAVTGQLIISLLGPDAKRSFWPKRGRWCGFFGKGSIRCWRHNADNFA